MNVSQPVRSLLELATLGAALGSGLIAGVFFAFASFVTRAWNVPLNDALAAVQPESAEGARVWLRYLVDWTLWNHVRTAASLAAAALFTLALLRQRAGFVG